MTHTNFLVVGAGPYGIATAAYAKSHGVQTTIVGKTLDFWKSNMPRGMFLRSGPDWHLDGRDECTFEAYLALRGLTHAQVKPVPLDTFLDYSSWFMGKYEVQPHNALVTHLARRDRLFHATLDDGSQLTADRVLLAPGIASFKHIPEELHSKLPPGSFIHTCDTVDFEYYRGKRVLIVGGRQSAFEWAAMINEKGAQDVHVTHRHATPKFTEPNWDWVQPMVRRTFADHAWWRKESAAEQDRIRHEFWSVGRLQLEQWLDARVHQPNIHIHEHTNVVAVNPAADNTFDVLLDDGTQFNVHHIILATGYRPNINHITYLDRATIGEAMETVEGYPVLDTEFQTTVPNLYVTGFASTLAFGPFFGFTVACPVAAKIIGDAVQT